MGMKGVFIFRENLHDFMKRFCFGLFCFDFFQDKVLLCIDCPPAHRDPPDSSS